MGGLPVPFWIDRHVAVFGALGEAELAFVETLRGLGANVVLEPEGVEPNTIEVAYYALGQPTEEDEDAASARVFTPFHPWVPLIQAAFTVAWAPSGDGDSPGLRVRRIAEDGLVGVFAHGPLHGIGLRLPPEHGVAGAGLDRDDLQAALLAAVEAYERLTRVRYDLSEPESVAAFAADTGWERVWDEAQTDQRFRART